MQHTKERTTVHTIVLTEQEAAWLREAISMTTVELHAGSPMDEFLTDLHNSLT